MPKVLFVDQYSAMGGGQRILIDVVDYFTANGMHSAVALPDKGPVATALVEKGISVVFFDMPDLTAGKKSVVDQVRYLPAVREMKKEIQALAEQWRADLIFCNGPRCLLPATLAAARLRIPVIAAVHLIFSGKEKAILSWCFNRPVVRAATFCSQVAADAFGDFPKGKPQLIGNWVSPEFLSTPKVPGARRAYGFAPSQLVVGVMGRISRNKGQRAFLEAMIPILKEREDAVLAFAGASDFEEPAEFNDLQDYAEKLGLAERIRFLGAVADPIGFLDAVDILAVPSLWEEPFGLVAVEGMARGLSVIATCSGGLKEIVADGETGFLVEKNPESMRAAVARLLQDSRLRAKMGARGIQRVKLFAPEPKLEAILQIAREETARRRAA